MQSSITCLVLLVLYYSYVIGLGDIVVPNYLLIVEVGGCTSISAILISVEMHVFPKKPPHSDRRFER